MLFHRRGLLWLGSAVRYTIKKNKTVLLFFRLRTSKTWLKVLSRNCIRLLIWSNVFFAWPVESVAPW